MSERITWTQESYSEVGRAGGFELFSVCWGTRRDPERSWSLSTRLPVSSPRLGQVHATREDAQAAAERILAAFLRRIERGGIVTAADSQTAAATEGGSE